MIHVSNLSLTHTKEKMVQYSVTCTTFCMQQHAYILFEQYRYSVYELYMYINSRKKPLKQQKKKLTTDGLEPPISRFVAGRLVLLGQAAVLHHH